MAFAALDTTQTHNRCGNCMEPYRAHRPRMSAAPTCPSGGVYREATEEELDAGYKAAFPDGPQPIATFKRDDPADMERLKHFLTTGELEQPDPGAYIPVGSFRP